MIINGAEIPSKTLEFLGLIAFYRFVDGKLCAILRRPSHIQCGINCPECMNTIKEMRIPLQGGL